MKPLYYKEIIKKGVLFIAMVTIVACSKKVTSKESNVKESNKTEIIESLPKKELGISNILLQANSDTSMTFEEMLAKHKGKIVLVDFWASWCGPCKKEIPALKSLKASLDPEKFSVVSISIDTKKESWEKSNTAEGLDKSGTSYMLDNWKETQLAKSLKISLIPRYVIFGKDGEILEKAAARPSDPALKAAVQKYF